MTDLVSPDKQRDKRFSRGRTVAHGELGRRLNRYRMIYLMILPGMLYYLVFKYIPMFGISIAFSDYQPNMGISGFFTANWIGFANFSTFFQSIYFEQVIRNTVLISFYKILFGFPFPIIFALMLNEMESVRFKKTIQTVSYLPHFISWVVLGGMMFELFSSTSGSITNLIRDLTGLNIRFFTDVKIFRSVLVASDIWKEMGWGSIIYLAALAGVDVEQYEAATVDGASRFRKIMHITLPGILSTILIMFVLRLGAVLDAGFEQVFILYSPQVMDVADIIDTYVYREGMISAKYGFATAVGLFKSVISFGFILTANLITKKMGNKGLF